MVVDKGLVVFRRFKCGVDAIVLKKCINDVSATLSFATMGTPGLSFCVISTQR